MGKVSFVFLTILFLVFSHGAKAEEEIKTISPKEVSELQCEKTSLITIFEYPETYIGERVCFLAYIYFDPEDYRSTAFFPAPLKTQKERYEQVAFPRYSLEIWEKIRMLPIGFPIYLQATFEDSSDFWVIPEDEELVPYKKMLYFDHIRLFIFE